MYAVFADLRTLLGWSASTQTARGPAVDPVRCQPDQERTAVAAGSETARYSGRVKRPAGRTSPSVSSRIDDA